MVGLGVDIQGRGCRRCGNHDEVSFQYFFCCPPCFTELFHPDYNGVSELDSELEKAKRFNLTTIWFWTVLVCIHTGGALALINNFIVSP